MILLHEFLYVDTDKVRGMLAQLQGGIEEEERSTTKSEKKTEGGVKGVLSHNQGWGEESQIQKSLGDSIFPTLEAELEAAGILQDVSEWVARPRSWHSDLSITLPPGSLVRITASGGLFDARYITKLLGGFVATWSGLVDMGAVGGQSKSSKSSPGPKLAKSRDTSNDGGQLEDMIPDFPTVADESGSFSPTLCRSIIKVSRGIFSPGLHLILTPTGNVEHAVGVRLQEGRQFLDSDPEILFARYGIGQQEWTVVGTIGHHGEAMTGEISDQLVDENGKVLRGRAASFINHTIAKLGALGFADLPQHPGFSVVPLAVYRAILPPKSASVVSTIR